jgi:SAM-dependent methyltransferase
VTNHLRHEDPKRTSLEPGLTFCITSRLDSLLSVDPRLRVVYWHGAVAVMNGEPPSPEALGGVALAVRRMLDRYFLVFDPAVLETRLMVEQVLFDLIANQYERLIDVANNQHNLRTLLRLVTLATHGNLDLMARQCLPGQPGSTGQGRLRSDNAPLARLEVLDYGCGTGLGATVAHEFAIHLIGCDRNPAMLAQARQRGLSVLMLDDLAALPEGSFDAVIAGYVLHLAVPSEELALVCRTIRDGGHLAANFHKGYGYDDIREMLGRFGDFTASDVTDLDSLHHGRYGLWRRDR